MYKFFITCGSTHRDKPTLTIQFLLIKTAPKELLAPLFYCVDVFLPNLLCSNDLRSFGSFNYFSCNVFDSNGTEHTRSIRDKVFYAKQIKGNSFYVGTKSIKLCAGDFFLCKATLVLFEKVLVVLLKEGWNIPVVSYFIAPNFPISNKLSKKRVLYFNTDGLRWT